MKRISPIKVPGAFRDRVWRITHPTGVSAIFTDYNLEITSWIDGAQEFPELGQHIRCGGNAYYVIGSANKRGWLVEDLGINENG